MIFVLDKKERVINTLKNNYSSNSANPYFNDVLIQDLATGAESYSFSTFAKGTITNDLVIGNYIAFKYKNSYKLFQITNVEITHEETMEISVYSECAGLSLLNNVFRKRTMTSCTLRKFIDAIVENTDWNTGLIEEAVNSVDLDIDTNTCYTVLQENIKEFGVELEFRVEINHGRVSKKYIDTYKQRGKVTGKRFVYGRDIEKVVKTVNSEQLYTALVGEGKNGESFRDITVSGIDKPLGQDFVADQESYEKYNRNGYHLMGVYTVDSDVPEVILRKTYEKLQEVKNPKISYEIPVIMLGELLGLEWDKVSIGDQIGILDTEFNPPLMLSARVSNLQISKSNPESSTCTLSNFIEVSSNITDEMRKIASKLEGYVDNKFPIGSDDIQEGAVNGTHMDKQYVTQITADIVQASTVKAEEVITDRITALNGRFETIEADSIKAKEIATEALNAGSVTAGRVDAVEGNFKTLSSDVATINTLVNGNLSSDNIQAGGITGDRLNMETIFVSNANIIDVNASKINAGEINTNKVHIQSANGGIVIADNTQQFKDKNGKVRIQMGQDATGNFTFGVFDSTGTGVLIDATGVKEKALADGIIKDRMIGSGEISGQKINISSLISQINSDTNTTSIKGTKVLLDTESQTLELAFSSLKKQADATKTATESNTTAISTANGSIQTLISNTTIVKDGQSLTLKDAYTATAQTVDSLKTTVGQHTTNWEENKKFVNTTESAIKQLKDDISLKVESTYVEEVFKSTVKSIDVQYYLSTSNTSLSGGSWTTTAPAWEKGKYIWSKTVTTYMSGLTEETTPICISGANGQDGSAGKGIKSIIEQYYLSTSATAQSGGSWSDTVPTWVDGKYMWTRSVITYTDNTSTTTSPICVTGGKGATGVGISSVDVEYYLSTSATAQSGGSWSTTAPAWVDGKYMWSRTKTTATNGTVTTSNPVCITGGKGATGSSGKGISKIDNYYLATNVSTGITSSTSGWTTTIQTINTTKKYLWNYEKITYTDSSVSETTPVIIGAHGSNGVNGSAGIGISSIVEYYLVSNLSTGVTTSTTGWTTSVPTMTTTNKYLWNYEKITYTDNSVTTDTPKVIGVYGETGNPGKSVASITEEYYLSDSKTTQSGGSWVTTPPTWSTGKYMWTRSKIVYKDPASTSYTTPVCDNSWEAVNEVQIGGRNLFRNSNFSNNLEYWNYIAGEAAVATDGSFGNVVTITTSSISKGINQKATKSLEVGSLYTLSCYVKANVATKVALALNGSGTANATLFDVSTSWTYVSKTFTNNGVNAIPRIYTGEDGKSVVMQIANPKFEEGNKATDWTPAPEDTDEKITSLTERVRKAELKIEDDQIIATVTSSTSWTTVSRNASTALSTANTANSTASTAKSTADSAKSTATSASSTASTALSTANSASSTASSASSTANSALSKATSASSTASSALSTASSAKSVADDALSTAITGNLYVKGTGANRSAPRLVQLNGKTVVNNSSRGMNLLVVKRSDLSVVSSTNYDIYGDATARTNLTTALNNLTDAVIVVITSYDAMVTDNNLDAAISRCGGSGTRFGGSFHRVPYALVGIPGIGQGAGIEVFTSVAASAPYAEISTKILNGTPQGINTTIREITTRMSAAELKITDTAIISTVQSTINTAKTDAINSANSSTDNKLKNYSTTTQMNTAIQQKADSITNTVSSNYLSKTDATNTYATKSSLTQTANKIVADFKASGGYNLLKNSKATSGSTFWVNNGGGISSVGDGTFGTCFKTSAPAGIKYGQAIKLKNNTEYVYEGYFYSKNVIGGGATVPLHFWCNTTPSGAGNPQLTILDYRQNVSSINTWTKCYVHFRTASSGNVYFTPFIYTGGSTTFDLWVTELSLSESSVESKWSPHPDEVYSGSTVIDANGVTIKNGAIKVQNNAGTTVLSGDSSGNLSITGTLITKSGNNTAIKLVNQNMYLYDWEGTTRTEPVGNVFSAKRIINGSTTSIPGVVLANHVNSYLALGYQRSGTSYGDYILLDKNGMAGQGTSFPIWVQENCIFNGSFIGIRNPSTKTYNRLWNSNGNMLVAEISTAKAGEGFQVQTTSGSALFNIIAGRSYPVVCGTSTQVSGNFTVTGSKNSLQKTENYGQRLINAYETTEYYFGDIGNGIIKNGECVIWIDDILKECINTNIDYHVFTQIYNGSIKRIERYKDYFIVYGEENTEFSWELKGKRKGYENIRLDTPDIGTVEEYAVFNEDDLKVKTTEEELLDVLTFDIENLLTQEV